MAFAERVVHLDDHDAETLVRVAAQEERSRIEHMTERARVRDERDPQALRVLTRGPELGPDPVEDVRCRVRQMVAIPEDSERSSVAPEQAQARVELVELVEVEGGVPNVVLEPVVEGPHPAMPHRPFQQVGSHAATSSSTSRSRAAMANPDRQPSSWNP